MKIYVFLTALLVGSNCLAGSTDNLTVTPIQYPAWICQASGKSAVMFAINPKIKKVWQSESGEQEAAELKVLRFEVLKCADCYKVECKFGEGGESVNYKLATRNSGKQMELDADLSMPGLPHFAKIDLPCVWKESRR